jgi:hypothetical protein
MCYGCVSGDNKGLTIVTTDNISYMNLNETTIKNLDNEIIHKVSSIYNIPIEYLLDKEKFVLLKPFINVCRLFFVSFDPKFDKKFGFDKDDFFIEPQTLPNELALFQNLEDFGIVIMEGGGYTNSAQGCYVNSINCVYIHEDKMLIFDGDSLVDKYQNIPPNIKYLNIIPTSLNLRQARIEEIHNYNFLPPHIEYLHFENKYLAENPKQTNLPIGLKKIISNVHEKKKNIVKVLHQEFITYSKIPFGCELVFDVFY